MKASTLPFLAFLILGCQTHKKDSPSADSPAANKNEAPAAPTSIPTPMAIDTAAQCVQTTPFNDCYEYTNLPKAGIDTVSATCKEISGIFTANAICSRIGIVGGCRLWKSSDPTETKLIIWYYGPDLSPDRVKVLCGPADEFVTPG